MSQNVQVKGGTKRLLKTHTISIPVPIKWVEENFNRLHFTQNPYIFQLLEWMTCNACNYLLDLREIRRGGRTDSDIEMPFSIFVYICELFKNINMTRSMCCDKPRVDHLALFYVDHSKSRHERCKKTFL